MDPIAPSTTLPALADRAQRHDGWTPGRQRAFLEAIAEGHSVTAACGLIGMAPSSAYALRRRAAGAGFALGWRAANLIARDRVADTLLARAIEGQVETLTRPDGATFTRHRYDNRLAATMLARLDRFADVDAGEATHHAARLVAAEFDGFLDLIDRDQGPARTGMFLAARIDGDAADPDLGAIVGLARADRWLRTGAGIAAEVDTADLDPDARAGWTADQWVRAEAAGLVAFAPVADTVRDSPLSPLHPEDDVADADDADAGDADAGADEGPDDGDDEPAWWDEYAEAWRTRFPPPAGFAGEEDGTFGDPDYERDVTPEEEEELAARRYRETATRWVIEACERDRWFAALNRCPIDPANDGDDGDADEGDYADDGDAAEAP